MLFFSEGIAIPPRDDRGLTADMQAVLAAAARANVAVYAFDPRGLRHINPDGLSGNGAEVSAAVLADNRTRILRAAMLRELAERTGGAAAVDSNDTLTPLARVAEESSHYYLLGYTPTDARRDGRFHSIDVRVRRPGLRVAARRGYVAPDDDRHAGKKQSEATGPLADLIRRPVPTAGLALARPGGRLSVGGRQRRGDRRDRARPIVPGRRDRRNCPSWTSSSSRSASGGRRSQPSRPSWRCRPRPTGRRRSTVPGSCSVSRCRPATTRSASRRARGGGAAGAVICELEVPDAKARGLAISGVVVGATHGGRLPVGRRRRSR